jgi:hypothetical protein
MAKFYLKNDWFAPDGSFWTAARVVPVEIPDHLVPYLPKSAEADDGKDRFGGKPVVPMMNIPVRGFRTVTSADTVAAKAEAVAAAAKPARVAVVPPEVVVAEAQVTAEGDEVRKAEKAPTRQRRG